MQSTRVSYFGVHVIYEYSMGGCAVFCVGLFDWFFSSVLGVVSWHV